MKRILIITVAAICVALAAWAVNEIKTTVVTEGYLRVNDNIGLQAGTDGDYEALFDGTKLTLKNSSSATVLSAAVGGNGERVGIGTASAVSRLHLWSGASGYSGTPSNALADGMAIENDDDATLGILTPGDGVGGVMFGDAAAEDRGGMKYDHTSDELQLWQGGAKQAAITAPGAFEWNGHTWTWDGVDGGAGTVLTSDGSYGLSMLPGGGEGGGGGFWKRVLSYGNYYLYPNASEDRVIIPGVTNGPTLALGVPETTTGSLYLYGNNTTYGPSITMWNALAKRDIGGVYWIMYPDGATFTIKSGVAGTFTFGYDGSFKTLSVAPSSGTSLALNAATLTSTATTVAMWPSNHVHVGGVNKVTTVDGMLNVDQAATFDTTLSVTGNTSLTGQLNLINGVPYSWPSSAATANNMALVQDTNGTVHRMSIEGLSIPDNLVLGDGSTSQGYLEVYKGAESAFPGTVSLQSCNGTLVYLCAGDDGTLRGGTTAPLSDGDLPLLVASGLRGTGSTSDAVDLDTAEVSGVLPAASVGAGLDDSQVANDLTISGGTIDDTVIGGVTPSSVTCTAITATGLTTCGGGVDVTNYPTSISSGQHWLMGYDPSGQQGILRVHDWDTGVSNPMVMEASYIALTQNLDDPLGFMLLGYAEDESMGFNIGSVIVSQSSVGAAMPFSVYSDGAEFDCNSFTVKARPDGEHCDIALAGRVSETIETEFTADDTTPSVVAGNMYTVPGTWTAGHDITDFDDGAAGQTIKICGGDSDCVITDAANLVLNGSWTAAADAVLVVTQWADGTWREESRSAN